MQPYPSLARPLYTNPISVGAAAVYAVRKDLLEVGERDAKYPDENGNTKFNLFREVGVGHNKRIWVPRNMAPVITEDLRVEGKVIDVECTFVPRNDEQARFIDETVELINEGRSFIAKAPPGFGKTWCATDIICKIGVKTIVVVTKDDIVDQWIAAIEALTPLRRGPGKGIGLIRGDICDTVGQSIVIAMVHSLAKEARYPEYHFRDFGLAVFDECHRMGADFFSQACFRLPAKIRLGLSGTPHRKDGREEVIHAHIGVVEVETSLAPMVPRVIVQESPWHCPTKRKLDKEGRVVMNEKGEAVVVPIPHTPGRTGHIVRMLCNHHGRNRVLADFTVQAFKKGRKVIFQSERRDHLELMASLITSLGVPPSKITLYVGGMTKKQRDEAKKGNIIMATYKMTSEATDIPTIDTLVMGTPMSEVEQIIGRATRFMEDKNEPIIFDLQDLTSPVFKAYSENRLRLYRSIGAKVSKHVPN